MAEARSETGQARGRAACLPGDAVERALQRGRAGRSGQDRAERDRSGRDRPQRGQHAPGENGQPAGGPCRLGSVPARTPEREAIRPGGFTSGCGWRSGQSAGIGQGEAPGCPRRPWERQECTRTRQGSADGRRHQARAFPRNGAGRRPVCFRIWQRISGRPCRPAQGRTRHAHEADRRDRCPEGRVCGLAERAARVPGSPW